MRAAEPICGTAAQTAGPDSSGQVAPAEVGAHHDLSWLDRFRRGLIVPASRAFAPWKPKSPVRGSSWSGACCRSPTSGDGGRLPHPAVRQQGGRVPLSPVRRHLQQVLGRDLTGGYLPAWAAEMATADAPARRLLPAPHGRRPAEFVSCKRRKRLGPESVPCGRSCRVSRAGIRWGDGDAHQCESTFLIYLVIVRFKEKLVLDWKAMR